MTKDFIHFVMVPFTGLGLHNGYRGDRWFKHRIELFKKYTLNSLLNQTNRNFIIWICLRSEEQDNPITRRFYQYMSKTDQPFVFTFGGIPIWDDKYKNDNLLERLHKILPQLKEYIKSEKWVYETCQPSDDIYHLRAMGEINKQKSAKRKALIHDKGFVVNEQTRRVAQWNPTTINPPFYTIMYPMEDFLDPQKHFDYMRGSKSHEDIIRLFDCTTLSDNKYCVLVHRKNISTNWWHPFRGKILSWEEGERVLEGFGLEPVGISVIVGGLKELKDIFRYLICRILIRIKFYEVAKRIKNSIERRFLNKDR